MVSPRVKRHEAMPAVCLKTTKIAITCSIVYFGDQNFEETFSTYRCASARLEKLRDCGVLKSIRRFASLKLFDGTSIISLWVP